MKNWTLVLLLFAFFFTTTLYSQRFERLDAPVTINGRLLDYPFAGGLNNPQFSEVDLNNDGLLDLFIFDRVGDVPLTFINEGRAGEVSYRYAPEYIEQFPVLRDWVALRDFDGDGIADIFAAPNIPVSGLTVYKGFREGNTIGFKQLFFGNEFIPDELVPISTPSGETQLYISEIDYPAIDDIDGDGDLDVLTFNINGGYIDYFQNRSVEMGYGRDSLLFILRDNCWGGFYESGITVAVDLADTIGACANRFTDDPPVDARHAGSTILSFDVDNDGDKDVVLGDLSFYNFNLLINGGTPQKAWMSDQDNSYPSYDVPVDMYIFPAAFYLDLNNDGAKDLVAAPNDQNVSENYNAAWFYKNVQDNATPRFELQQKDLFIDNMIDFGSGTNPTFVDYNADGLLDLVVGNSNLFLNPTEQNSRLFLFENVGTATAPAFKLVDDDYLGLRQFTPAVYNFAPTFGDLDNDGDLDALIGEQFGTLLFAENIAGPNAPFQFAPVVLNYQNIDPGQVSTPHIIDVNKDGLPDLLIGELNGNVNYYENKGTPSAPLFEANPAVAPNIERYGLVDSRLPGFFSGYSAPVVVATTDGLKLMTGSEVGIIKQYDMQNAAPTDALPLEDPDFGNLNIGIRTRPAFADLDADGFLEMVIGNLRGGLSLFRTPLQLPPPVATDDIFTSSVITVYPNPAEKMVRIQSSDERIKQVKLYSIAGQELLSQVVHTSFADVNVESLPAGLYLLQVSVGDRFVTTKLVKQ